jgi:hypothetical protein
MQVYRMTHRQCNTQVLINDTIQHIKSLGHDTYVCKTDIRSAFRVLPVSPQDYELLGFTYTTISVCPWAVALDAKYLRPSAPLFNG